MADLQNNVSLKEIKTFLNRKATDIIQCRELWKTATSRNFKTEILVISSELVAFDWRLLDTGQKRELCLKKDNFKQSIYVCEKAPQNILQIFFVNVSLKKIFDGMDLC